jgi:hypothetical protein
VELLVLFPVVLQVDAVPSRRFLLQPVKGVDPPFAP